MGYVDHQTQPDTGKPWLTKRRFWTGLVVGSIGFVVLMAVVVYVGYVSDVPLRISPETTYITEPLTADGTRVDYFAVAEQMTYSPEMATEENGFRIVVQALGVDRRSADERSQVCTALGLDSPVVPTMEYQDPADFLTEYGGSVQVAGEIPPHLSRWAFQEELVDRLDRPWTLEDLPMMGDWLNENSPALDLVAEALRKPVFRLPLLKSRDGTLLDSTHSRERQQLTSCARGLEARAQFHIGDGNIDGAINDIISCALIGRHLEHGDILYHTLIGYSWQNRAYSIGVGSLIEHQPTAEQWQRLLTELDELPAHASVTDTLEVERLRRLDLVQSEARKPRTEQGEWLEVWGSDDYVQQFQDRTFGIDWNGVASRVNSNCDAILRGAPVPTTSPSALRGFMLRNTRSKEVGDMLSEVFADYYEVQPSSHRNRCKENLLRIVIAMLLYEKEHGTLPPAYSVDEQGNPLQNWRVLILPYLGYNELYARIRLDEPWDSAHNRQFHAADVPIYQCPSGHHAAGMTTYAVVEGDTAAFQGGQPRRLDEFGPHSAHLILVAERLEAACWMDPTREVPLAEAQTGINLGGPKGLGSEHEGGMHVALRSGAIRFISENIAPEELLGLLEGTIEYVP